jgi:hypothetical protein
MSVRKRTWRNGDGSRGSAWVVAFTDENGRQRQKSFHYKWDANAYQAEVRHARALADPQTRLMLLEGQVRMLKQRVDDLEAKDRESKSVTTKIDGDTERRKTQ